MTARYEGDRVITAHARPWLLPEWTESPQWPYGHPDPEATTRTVRRFPRPAEPARWMIRETGGRGNWVTWFDVDDRNSTARTPITFHRQTRTVTDWVDVEPELPMGATR